METRKPPVFPNTVIFQASFPSYESKLHIHAHEAFQPCLIISNDSDEIHAFLRQDQVGDWRVKLVIIKKGRLSPVPDVGIGDSLAELQQTLPNGKMMVEHSEVNDPVIFRARLEGHTVDFVVEWEEEFRRQGGNWKTFDPQKVPKSATILLILWH